MLRVEKNDFWYVVYTNPRQESRVHSNLTALGVETFLPKVKKQRLNQFTGETIPLIKPLFPRYIFARFEIGTLLHKVRYTRGIHSVLSFGNGPVQIDEQIITIIQAQIGINGFVITNGHIKIGDIVKIKEGPLKELTGIFEREMSDSERVLILLNAINFQAHVKIERELIQRIC